MDVFERIQIMREVLGFLLPTVDSKPTVVAEALAAAKAHTNGVANKKLPGEPKARKQKSGPSPSPDGVSETIRRHLMKMGVRQTFKGDELKDLFSGPVKSSTLAQAMKRLTDSGCVVRTHVGRGRAPSTYQKVKMLEGED